MLPPQRGLHGQLVIVRVINTSCYNKQLQTLSNLTIKMYFLLRTGQEHLFLLLFRGSPWVAYLQVVAQRSQPFPFCAAVFPGGPLGLLTGSSVCVLLKRKRKNTQRISTSVSGTRSRVAHITYAHIPVAKAGVVVTSDFSGRGSALHHDGQGRQSAYWLTSDSH